MSMDLQSIGKACPAILQTRQTVCQRHYKTNELIACQLGIGILKSGHLNYKRYKEYKLLVSQ